jgi:hypothetical protein
LAQHPELAEDLDACLASLEFIRQASLIVPPLADDENAVEAGDGEAGIGDLGDFRLIAEVDRGGHGGGLRSGTAEKDVIIAEARENLLILSDSLDHGRVDRRSCPS